MHDHEAACRGEQLAHLSESYFVASEDEDVKDDVLGNSALDEGVVVLLGAGEVFYVLPLA